jgi:hypothetical protein
MLEKVCDVCGCECDNMSYGFDAEIRKTRIGVVCVANEVLNESIAKELNGECVLHGEGEYVNGYTYLTYDEEELEMINYIRGYLEGHIRCFELK